MDAQNSRFGRFAVLFDVTSNLVVDDIALVQKDTRCYRLGSGDSQQASSDSLTLATRDSNRWEQK